MPLGGYFKGKPKAKPEPLALAPEPEKDERRSAPMGNEMEMLPSPKFESSRNSISGRSINSTNSHIEDIKHEVMVNFLYQQQCSHMWIGEQGGVAEGVLLRKSRSNYLACPPDLAQSSFHDACVALNIHVS